jgi:hypothetical protein
MQELGSMDETSPKDLKVRVLVVEDDPGLQRMILESVRKI